MNLTTIRRQPKPWERPQFEQPMPTSPTSLTPLGEIRGRRWWQHAQYGELEENLVTIRDDDRSLPSSVIVHDDSTGERRWRTFSIHAPGTFERRVNAPLRGTKQVPPDLPVDALAHLHLMATMSQGRATWTGGSRPPVRGPEQILARLKANGATVSLSSDRTTIEVASSGGRPAPGVMELAKESAPLLVPFLKGSPATCTNSRHRGQPRDAVTLSGGTPTCDGCLTGGAS